MSNGKQGQAKLLVPHRYRIRQAISPAANTTELEDEDTASNYSLATGRWTRGSCVSSFIDGELGSTLGRLMRAGGRVVIDPIDNFIGSRELKRLEMYLDDLDYHGWRTLKDRFDAEGYAPRLVEVLRYQVYPGSLRLRAQTITLKLAVFGQIHFDQVIPRIHFYTKDEFDESIKDLCATAISLIPRQQLLDCIFVSDDKDGFLWSLRREVFSSAEVLNWPNDDYVLFLLAQHLFYQGRLREAEELFFKATEGRKRLQGAVHPHTLVSMGWLAATYLYQDRRKESEELLFNFITRSAYLLEEEHYTALSTGLMGLALVYFGQGRWKESEELAMEVLDLTGWDNSYRQSNALIILCNVAFAYQNQGRWKEAGKLIIRVFNKLLGGNVNQTMRDLVGSLAVTHQYKCVQKDGEKLNLMVVDKRDWGHAKGHPSIVSVCCNLTSTYLNQVRWKQAKEIALKLLLVSVSLINDVLHPDKLLSLAGPVNIDKKQSHLKEDVRVFSVSQHLLSSVPGGQTSTVEPEHWQIIRNLSSTLRMIGRHGEADELELEVGVYISLSSIV